MLVANTGLTKMSFHYGCLGGRESKSPSGRKDTLSATVGNRRQLETSVFGTFTGIEREEGIKKEPG